MKNTYERLEILHTHTQVARALGLSRMTIYRYRQWFPDFPTLPNFKATIQHWASRRGLPLRRGPQPSQRRTLVVHMRREEGKSFRQIARELGVSVQAVWQLWQRHSSASG